jgi:hypothetical protein
MSNLAARFAIPAGLVLMAANASLVSVYGGQRAIIFDRFQGVKPQVSGYFPFFSNSTMMLIYLLLLYSR